MTESTLLGHHIYEIRKGVRRLALLTLKKDRFVRSLARLDTCGVAFLAQECGSEKINLFLGDPACLSVVESFCCPDLSRLSPEQDFMLGALLGYDLSSQCNRYFVQKERHEHLGRRTRAA
jgi:hypothetical protein